MFKLQIAIDSDVSDDIKEYYQKLQDKDSLDSGVDLVVPEDIEVLGKNLYTEINHKIKCQLIKDNNFYPYYLYPRSSFSKYPLIMANHVGIIDKTYRGDIKARVKYYDNVLNTKITALRRMYELQPDYFEAKYTHDLIKMIFRDSDNNIKLKKGSKLFQLCSSDLSPMKVEIIDTSQLTTTNRGEKGFGSTGISI